VGGGVWALLEDGEKSRCMEKKGEGNEDLAAQNLWMSHKSDCDHSRRRGRSDKEEKAVFLVAVEITPESSGLGRYLGQQFKQKLRSEKKRSAGRYLL